MLRNRIRRMNLEIMLYKALQEESVFQENFSEQDKEILFYLALGMDDTEVLRESKAYDMSDVQETRDYAYDFFGVSTDHELTLKIFETLLYIG
jgi:hypothetical protein